MTTNKPEVKRYDCTSGRAMYCYGCYTMEEGELGDYVEWEAYEALQAERDAAFALLRECQLILREECGARIDYVELNAFLEGRASATDILAALDDTASKGVKHDNQ